MIVPSIFRQFAAACTGAETKDINGEVYCTELPQSPASQANVQNIVHIIVGTLAVLAILIIVFSALNIVTAGGDAAKVAKARSAIIYALIGLAIVVTADAIVMVVIGRI